MKSKNIKVTYKNRFQNSGTSTVPKIQMEGKWLEDLGFSIGETIRVEYSNGSIVLRPLSEEEQAAEEYQRLQSQWRKKSAELELLGRKKEYLSQVAEDTGTYGDERKTGHNA